MSSFAVMERTSVYLKVSGMTSEHCATTVRNLVQDERGVESVEVFLEKNTISVSGNAAMSKQDLIQAINLSGIYDAN
jgi:copper chaperone CopZ